MATGPVDTQNLPEIFFYSVKNVKWTKSRSFLPRKTRTGRERNSTVFLAPRTHPTQDRRSEKELVSKTSFYGWGTDFENLIIFVYLVSNKIHDSFTFHSR